MEEYLKGYKNISYLSNGSFKEVYRIIEDIEDDKNDKVLKLAHKNTNPKEIQYLLNEVICNGFLESKYILNTIELHLFPTFYSIIEPIAYNGTLGMLLKNLNETGDILNEFEIWKFFIQLVDAIYFLHKMGICHRDLKPDNILLDKQFYIKIHDFNSCSIKRYNKLYNSTIIGTPLYMSPRVISGKQYIEDVDIWSIGCILYEMIEGHSPFSDVNNWIKLYENITNIEYIKPKRKDISRELQSWIPRLLRKTRINITSIRKMIGSKSLEYGIKMEIPKKNQTFEKYKNIQCSTWNEFVHILKNIVFVKNYIDDNTNIRECLQINKKNICYKTK